MSATGAWSEAFASAVVETLAGNADDYGSTCSIKLISVLSQHVSEDTLLRDCDTPDALFTALCQRYMDYGDWDALFSTAGSYPDRIVAAKPHLLMSLIYRRRWKEISTETFCQAVTRLDFNWSDDPNAAQKGCLYAYSVGDVELFATIVDVLGHSPLSPELLAQYDPANLSAIDNAMGAAPANDTREARCQCIEHLLPRPKNANA